MRSLKEKKEEIPAMDSITSNIVETHGECIFTVSYNRKVLLTVE